MLLLTKRLVTPKLITREGTSAAAIPSVSCERIDFGFKEFIRRESWDRCAELSMMGKADWDKKVKCYSGKCQQELWGERSKE
jgi:hypothetical protein